MNNILGFASINSNYSCRSCERLKSEMQIDNSEINGSSRSTTQYDREEIYEKMIWRQPGQMKSLFFNKKPSFHVIHNTCFDIMHDLYEEVCSYNMCHLIKKLILKNFFTLDILHEEKKCFIAVFPKLKIYLRIYLN